MFLERDEMKFAILYTLKRHVEPASMARLSEILTWEKEVMGYFDLAELLGELMEDGYVRENFYRGERCYGLSPKGADANSFFFERVPKSIRNRIDKAVGAIKYGEQADPRAVTAEVVPVAPQQYAAELRMLEAGSAILEIRLFAGSKGQAERAARAMKRDAGEIYRQLIARVEKRNEDQQNSEEKNS